MSGLVFGSTNFIEVVPTISTSAYASGDQIGGLMTLTGAVLGSGRNAILQSIVVSDSSKQNAAIDILFFSASVSVAGDNSAAAISGADMAAYYLGHVSIAAAQYTSLSATSGATDKNTGLALQTPANSRAIYALAVARGTPTYASTSALKFKFFIAQD